MPQPHNRDRSRCLREILLQSELVSAPDICPGNASRILQQIKQKVSGLHTVPHRGRIVPELKAQGIHTYREFIVAPWRVIYRITDTTVFVVSVIDSRRNVEDLLLDRFVK
ncbi:MAG: type II toxin-antitoxin system RelE/ParE family toxin [Thermodesulfobacteriota bacterium]